MIFSVPPLWADENFMNIFGSKNRSCNCHDANFKNAFIKRKPKFRNFVERGRCASRYLICAARKNARNLTVACMCRTPPSCFARLSVCFDVALDDAAHVFHYSRKSRDVPFEKSAPRAMKISVVMGVMPNMILSRTTIIFGFLGSYQGASPRQCKVKFGDSYEREADLAKSWEKLALRKLESQSAHKVSEMRQLAQLHFSCDNCGWQAGLT